VPCAATRAGTRCPIPNGAVGVCKVRFNRGGRLMRPGATSAGVALRPDREEAVLPRVARALAYSFGMLGCDLHCSYCQNWLTSQALRDPAAIVRPTDATPEELVAEARRFGARPWSARTTSR
jgi:pyruvate formate lyase activating enzyme